MYGWIPDILKSQLSNWYGYPKSISWYPSFQVAKFLSLNGNARVAAMGGFYTWSPVIKSQTLLGMWLLIHVGIKVNPR